ncbi:MAG TPA: SDR family oxidoreductase [Pirellulales bacterium]|jgi:NAD(P)-dependent dehydrogenase (short-subunit alcohol dehydrogenase family)|nr:SDR family oxidoreductase [Pirellulales bacterium]
MRLANKTAIVTGAGSGIGRAIAELFAREGANVLVAEIEEATGQQTVATIAAAGGKARCVRTDVSSDNDCRAMAEAAESHFGPVQVLVNNAAAFVFGKVELATRADWDRVLAVNVLGPAQCAKHVLPSMRRAGGGSIVNIASVSGFIAQPAFVPYNSSKGALLQMTRCMALDLASEQVRVNAICPGEIHTRATDYHIQKLGIDRDVALAKLAAVSPMQRMGRPIEVAYAALYLASDEASFVTGAELVVDGGATLD